MPQNEIERQLFISINYKMVSNVIYIVGEASNGRDLTVTDQAQVKTGRDSPRAMSVQEYLTHFYFSKC